MFDQDKFERLARKFLTDFDEGKASARRIPEASLARLKAIEIELSTYLREARELPRCES
jgi:hypothetical protein